MTTIKQRIIKLQNVPGGTRRRIKVGIRLQMETDESFDAKWWDTEVTESKWKEMLKEALK
tara:strand:- start:712 stop:891 length:180 start_codon:yes stop_codon:yes gene_type:complete